MKSVIVNVGGKEREISFGLKTIGDCIKHQGNDPAAFMTSLAQNSFEAVPLIFYYGAKYADEKKKRIPDFELLDVYEWVEDEGLQSETVDKVTKAFIRSLYENVPAIREAIDAQPEEVKKNLIGTPT